jgi:hypothetical protein
LLANPLLKWPPLQPPDRMPVLSGYYRVFSAKRKALISTKYLLLFMFVGVHRCLPVMDNADTPSASTLFSHVRHCPEDLIKTAGYAAERIY